MRLWEKEVPLGVAEGLRKFGKESSSSMLEKLGKEKVGIETPIGEVRKIAKSYSKRYKVPVRVTRIDDDIWESNPYADAVHSYCRTNGKIKSIIYLHPVLQYYPKSYIKGVIEHELDHRKVEVEWERKL